MSLNWSTINCKTTPDMYEEEMQADGTRLLTDHAADTRHSLLFNMMFVGISELKTRVHCETFYNRYLQLNLSQGVAPKDVYLKYPDVVMWQGIGCNASDLTDAAFFKEIKGNMNSFTWESFKSDRIAAADKE